MINLGKKLGFAALLALGVVSSAQSSVLDTFDYGFNVALAVGASSGDSDTSGVLTGVTDTTPAGDVVYTLTKTSDSDFGATGGALFTSGLLYLFNDDGTSNLQLNYFDEVGGPVGGLDITDGGSSDQFYFDVEFIDLGFFLDLIVMDIDGGISTLTFEQTEKVENSDPTKRIFASFASFTPGADFSKVATITALIRSTVDGADLKISEVGTTNIPEPTTVAIFGLALVGFAFSSRKKA